MMLDEDVPLSFPVSALTSSAKRCPRTRNNPGKGSIRIVAVISGFCEDPRAYCIADGPLLLELQKRQEQHGLAAFVPADCSANSKSVIRFHGLSLCHWSWDNPPGAHSGLVSKSLWEFAPHISGACFFRFEKEVRVALGPLECPNIPSSAVNSATFQYWLLDTFGDVVVSCPDAVPLPAPTTLKEWVTRLTAEHNVKVTMWKTHSVLAALLVRGMWKVETRAITCSPCESCPVASLGRKAFSANSSCHAKPTRKQMLHFRKTHTADVFKIGFPQPEKHLNRLRFRRSFTSGWIYLAATSSLNAALRQSNIVISHGFSWTPFCSPVIYGVSRTLSRHALTPLVRCLAKQALSLCEMLWRKAFLRSLPRTY